MTVEQIGKDFGVVDERVVGRITADLTAFYAHAAGSSATCPDARPDREEQ
ncbi:hypothetical protein [Actinophytocola oryzae]|uniref:Uncharacterized protein n=1 Tax=Actinophytocola oryzae TaxID=502181 RepID=A0A4R7URS6_9PSEU|nr:hypothetical protein [Actinophytocola oryzae]TDV37782.1 hypothetical protein CLV71_12846 [Actinophytocola oryzae]